MRDTTELNSLTLVKAMVYIHAKIVSCKTVLVGSLVATSGHQQFPVHITQIRRLSIIRNCFSMSSYNLRIMLACCKSESG